MQMTERDEAMLAWLDVVGLADVDAVRWALAGLSGNSVPVTTRRANVWISRLVEVGLLGRGRPNFRDGSIVWASHQATGKTAPNLYRQTTRHEVAVAAVSARYLAHGYTWEADRKVPKGAVDVSDGRISKRHVADGVAVKGDLRELIEVELTPKNLDRYKDIFTNHLHRIKYEGAARVVYLGTPEASRVVARELDKWVHHERHPQFPTMPVFDVRGNWITGDFGLWGTHNQDETVDAGGVVGSSVQHDSIHGVSSEGNDHS